MDKCFGEWAHAIAREWEVGCMFGQGGQKNEVLVRGSSVGVDYMGCEGNFGGGVEADYSGEMSLWIRTKFLNQPLLRPFSFFFSIPHVLP